jgi:hypothetical protein
MSFILGKFTSLKWLRLLGRSRKSTTQWAPGTCVPSVEAEISPPRSQTNILYDGPPVFVPSLRPRPFLYFEGGGIEAACYSPSNDNASQTSAPRRGFKDSFATPTYRYGIKRQTGKEKLYQLRRGIP